ncbi:WRKY transcription factor 55 [Euphorbia lathyris]|uniref:WRKY transcription factor 55 n=1 Tax=Euphorbia lathyris TaxID=212925 RepID=UPI003313AC60
MDNRELISIILEGIRLAKQVEPMLQRLGNFNQEEMVLKLDEIIRVFMEARERLYDQQQKQENVPISLEEYYAKSMMELLQNQTQNQTQTQQLMPYEVKSGSSDMGMDMEDVQAMAASSSSNQRPRKRKNDGEKRTMMVAAPRMGNTEIPPEDGYTWRKYGQKEILGSKFPRGYYRCTHQKLYQCPAKKQVQRLDDDPFTFEVTYRADHTCHMSATAPSSAPPSQPPVVTREMMLQQPVVTREMMTQMTFHHHHPQLPWLEFSLSGGNNGAGPSSVLGGGGNRYSKEIDQYLVADLADVMFNSGSSSSNTMETIFTSTSMEDKWDTRDNKKN